MTDSPRRIREETSDVRTIAWAAYWLYVGALLANLMGRGWIAMALSLIAFTIAIGYQSRDANGIYRSHFVNVIVVSVVGIVVGLLLVGMLGIIAISGAVEGAKAGFYGVPGDFDGARAGMRVVVVIGLASGIWTLLRIVRGMLYLNGDQPYPKDGKGFI